MSPNISIIGVGRLGGALALALSKGGYRIKQLISRRQENSRRLAEMLAPAPEILSADELEKVSSEIIFIATPDPQIKFVGEQLAGKLNYKPVVFHTSGALSSSVLESLRESGVRIGSLHPLVSISDARLGAERFRDAFFCLEGDAEAVRLAEKIVADLRGRAFSVETRFKPLYHASAVMASGHLTALFSAAVESLSACGLNQNEAQEVLLPLVKSTVENLSAQTPAQALTGTFARADVDTLTRHLSALRENVSPEILSIYARLGLRSLILAGRQDANAERLAEMKRLLMKIRNLD